MNRRQAILSVAGSAAAVACGVATGQSEAVRADSASPVAMYIPVPEMPSQCYRVENGNESTLEIFYGGQSLVLQKGGSADFTKGKDGWEMTTGSRPS